jgi:Flp pilus assembly protein TadG
MKQKGAQAVEFALVLPFFILILLAVLDFGMLAYNKAIITNASREGVRSGVVLSAAWSAEGVRQSACNYVRNTLISVNSEVNKTTTCKGTVTNDLVVSLYAGSNATCPTPTGAEFTGTIPPAFGVPVVMTISYPFKGFWLGTGTSVSSAIKLNACTQMVHE